MDILSFILGYNKGKAQASGGETADAVLDEVEAYLDTINGGSVNAVTFVGADGRTLCTVNVPNGEDCPDPVATWLISKPTQTSTADLAYEFVGWSKYENGPYDGDALKNVTGNRTLYVVMQAIRIRGSLGGTSYWVASTDRTTIDIYGNGALERISGEIWDITFAGHEGIAPAVGNTVTTVKFHNEDGVITSIGRMLFITCTDITNIEIPTTVTSIGESAFAYCYDLKNITIPASVRSIGVDAFERTGLKSATFEVTSGWKGTYTDADTGAVTNVSISSTLLADPSSAATALKDTYQNYEWTRS